MITRELFRRRVIELIHGLSYEEAIKKESVNGKCECRYKLKNGEELIGTTYKIFSRNLQEDVIWSEILGFPITIGRVIKAFANKNISLNISLKGFLAIYDFNFSKQNHEYCMKNDILDNYNGAELDVFWKLTDEYGSDCTDDNQTDETIDKLYNLIK